MSHTSYQWGLARVRTTRKESVQTATYPSYVTTMLGSGGLQRQFRPSDPRAPMSFYNPFNLPPAFLPPTIGGPAGWPAFLAHQHAASVYAAACLRFLEQGYGLLEAHPSQFLVHAPLARLPPAWEADIRAAAPGEPLQWLLPQACPPPPGSLRAWFATATTLALPRTAVSLTVKQAPRREASFTCLKKAHELERFAAAAADAAASCGCRKVVDAGAGSGRLGGLLAAAYGLSVVGVERDGDAVARAARRRAWADRSQPAADCVVNQGVLDASCHPDEPQMLVGLHACGELTSEALRAFASTPQYRSLLIVGCCYQHCDDAALPLSAAVRTLEGTPLTGILPRCAREAAAQSVSAAFLSSQPHTKRATMRMRTLARALLELLHVERGIEVGAGKHPYDHARFSSFAQYAALTLGPFAATDAVALDARFAAVLATEDCALAGFTAARCAAGAVAEALLITDRALFLAETLCAEHASLPPEVAVLPLFDDAVSPRSIALFARRTE